MSNLIFTLDVSFPPRRRAKQRNDANDTAAAIIIDDGSSSRFERTAPSSSQGGGRESSRSSFRDEHDDDTMMSEAVRKGSARRTIRNTGAARAALALPGERTRDDDEAPPAVSSGNYLRVDGLVSVKIAVRDDKPKVVYKRVCMDVPWIPTLFVAVRSDYLRTLRRDINFYLGLNGYGPMSCQPCFAVNCMARETTEFAWRFVDETYVTELQFADFTARALVRRYLQDRAPARSGDFQIFAVDSVAFNVALSTYATELRLKNGNVCDSDDETVACDEGGYRGTGDVKIDLTEYFRMCSWCEILPRQSNYVRCVSDERIALNDLPSNPLADLPVVSFDIETIARNDNTLPRGVEVDQRLSSLAVTIHPPATAEASDEYCAHVYAYAPLPSARNEGGYTGEPEEEPTPERLKRERHWRRRLDRYENEMSSFRFAVSLYDSETELLIAALHVLTTNQFLVKVYGLVDPDDARDIACILLGYNSWEYDHFFLAMRLYFYGFEREADALMETYGKEPRFAPSQISFDLLKNMLARYRGSLGSVSLSNATRYFCANDAAERDLSAEARQCKMKFDAVAIRSLYYDTSTGEERFDRRRVFDDRSVDSGVNMTRVLRYNAQDCASVYFLYKNTNFLDNVVEYARMFYVGPVEASYVGNNRLLSNVFTAQAMALNGIVVPYRSPRLCGVQFPRYRAADHARTTLEMWTLENLRVVCDETRVLRVGSKAFIGGINSALAAVYHRCCVAKLDFKSFYPYLALLNQLSYETTLVFTVRQFVNVYAGGDRETVDALIADGFMRVYDYEPDCEHVRKWHHGGGDGGSDGDENDDAWCVFASEENVREHEEDERRRETELRDGESWQEHAHRLAVLKRQRLNEESYSRGNDSRSNDGYGNESDSRCNDSRDSNDTGSGGRLRRTIRGVDRLAADTLREHHGWYEGVEFRSLREIVDSSRDLDKRRVAVTVQPPDPHQKPFVANLWERFLNKRAHYKKMMAQAAREGDEPRERLCSALQLIYKVLVNSMFGVLGFQQNVLYTPAVSALITKFSRKYFHESQTIVERYFPEILCRERPDAAPIRCRIVYRDTDGMLVFADRPMTLDEARLMTDAVNENLHKTRPTMSGTKLELELEAAGADLYSCTVMGRKKYWESSESGKFVTKGFEKNAPPFIKHIVRIIQTNCHVAIRSVPRLREHAAFRLALSDPREFFVSMYDRLHEYYERFGLADFVFGIVLTPRENDSTDIGRFVQHALQHYDYDVGDRVSCVYALDPSNIGATVFRTKNDFDPRTDRINYYKSVRRFAIYFLQQVEGFKRCGGSDDRDEHREDRAWREGFAMGGKRFDDCLVEAYEIWLGGDSQDAERRKYAPFFATGDSGGDECVHRLIETVERHAEVRPMRVF